MIRYSYDSDGRVTKNEAQETAGGIFAQKAVFTYDPNSNLLSHTDDWGTTAFTYDQRNQPTKATYPTGKAVSISYTSTGQVASITYPNGLTVTYTYDDFNRLVIPARFRNAAGAELQGGSERPNNITRLALALGGVTKSFDFAYDKAGNRVSATLPNSTSTTYVYDNAQRVTNVLHKAGAATLVQCNLAYNKVGSVTQETASGSAHLAPALPTADTATYDACNQVTKRNNNTYTYDADGNLMKILDGTFAATYTPENRPSAISRIRDGVKETIQYTYDAAGLRVKRVVGTTTTQFHYGPDGSLLFTTDGAGNVTASFVWNGPVLAAVLTGSSLNTDLRFPHLNRLGNVLALTDSTGALAVKYAYQPYGFASRAGNADSNPFTFVGGLGVQDEGGGLFYMKNRFYDATSGRFLQRDPIGFEGGINLYAYVNANPINFSDPSGLVGGSPSNPDYFAKDREKRMATEIVWNHVNGSGLIDAVFHWSEGKKAEAAYDVIEEMAGLPGDLYGDWKIINKNSSNPMKEPSLDLSDLLADSVRKTQTLSDTADVRDAVNSAVARGTVPSSREEWLKERIRRQLNNEKDPSY